MVMNYPARTCPALILVALILIGCGAKPGGEAKDAEPGPVPVELTPVQVKSVATTVTAQGIVTAAQGGSVKVGAVSAGRIANVLVKEGELVKAGQLVALIENKAQASQSASAIAAQAIAEAQAHESALNAKSAELDQKSNVQIANIALETAIAERRSAIRQAEYDLREAQLELKKALQGNRPQEVAQAEQAENQAQVAKDAAEREEKRNAYLLSKGIVSQKTYDDSKAALQNAVAGLISAQSQLSLVKEGPRSEDKQAAQIKVDGAAQALTSTRAIQDRKVLAANKVLLQANQGELQVQAKRQEAAASEKTVLQKTADASAAQAVQAQLEVRAPVSGKVVRRMLNPGDTPDNNSPILEIISTSGGLDLVASLPSANGAGLKPGLKAAVTVAGKPDTPIEGTILSVGQVDPQSGLLSMRIRLGSTPAWLSPGTFASAELVLHENPNALVVPKASILTRDGATIVFVANGEKAKLTKVTVGQEQDGLVEIISGLTKDQSVVSLGNYELSDGSEIKAAEKADEGDKKDAADKKDDGKADDAKKDDTKKDDEKPAGAGAK